MWKNTEKKYFGERQEKSSICQILKIDFLFQKKYGWGYFEIEMNVFWNVDLVFQFVEICVKY